ncbi:hypothetical protein QAD02_003037 [Eretmocerus hayati]|uniref:Uncharacterized protein n=1 Tax=Eretmocerus hayati TaxID=131215 RepID=A0ACC2NLU5_9HYME|nr:hypothetical protein QAD02_003037 [Eretmocerus hayati]
MAKGKSPSKIARDLRRSLEKKQRKLATQEEILQKKLENQLRHDLEVVVARCAALESLVEKKDAEIKSSKIENAELQKEKTKCIEVYNYHELVKWEEKLKQNKK